jgi:hypothetical protein
VKPLAREFLLTSLEENIINQQKRKEFMLLDMKSSTTIAKSLGHVRYFEMLKEYYSDVDL